MRCYLLIIVFVSGFFSSRAQSKLVNKNLSYSELFKEAKLELANHREKDAIPLLEELYKRDKENANVAYLLGLCYVKSFKNINRAIELLENAKDSYSKFYDRTSVTERGVSEYVYYYLIIGYSIKGDCKRTIATLNDFYRIYSYEDEWFLIDGQKWHRECGKHKWTKDDTIASPKLSVDSAEGPLLDSSIEDSASLIVTSTGAVADSNMNKTVEKIQEEVNTKVPYRGQYRERLKRVGEAGGPEVMTRGVNYTARSALFGVQIGAYIKPRFSKDFKGLKNVEVYIDNYGVFRYVIGRFVYKSQAEKLLQYVVEEGYTDAFIVDVQSSQNYEEEVVRVNNQSIKREISGKVDYRVQIGAFKEEVPDDIMRIYLKFDDIKENIQKDLTIFTIGSFNNYEITKAFCDNIKENGIPDAFVVAFNQSRKISLQEAETYLQRKREEELQKNREVENQKRKKKKK